MYFRFLSLNSFVILNLFQNLIFHVIQCSIETLKQVQGDGISLKFGIIKGK